MHLLGLSAGEHLMDKDFYASEKWNMAMAYHKRIDDLLTSCTLAQMNNDGLMWYKSIYRLYIEIQAKMNDKEKGKAEELIGDLIKWKTEAMKKTKGAISTAVFVKAELFLRQCLESKNMLTPKPEDLRGL